MTSQENYCRGRRFWSDIKRWGGICMSGGGRETQSLWKEETQIIESRECLQNDQGEHC